MCDTGSCTLLTAKQDCRWLKASSQNATCACIPKFLQQSKIPLGYRPRCTRVLAVLCFVLKSATTSFLAFAPDVKVIAQFPNEVPQELHQALSQERGFLARTFERLQTELGFAIIQLITKSEGLKC